MTDIQLCQLIEYDGKRYDLVHSPDDLGWYLQRHTDDYATELFDTPEQLLRLLKVGELEFSE